MPLPAASFINQLDPGQPTGTQKKYEGDDWLRLLQLVLQTQFPNLGPNAVLPTALELNTITRAIRVPVGEVGPIIPAAASRANGIWVWDATGVTPTFSRTLTAFDADVANTNIKSGLATTAAVDAATARDLAQKWATQLSTEVVAGQGYSAKYNANLSAASAALSQSWATQPTGEVVPGQGKSAFAYTQEIAGLAVPLQMLYDILYYGVANVLDPQWAGGASPSKTAAQNTAAFNAALAAPGKFVQAPASTSPYLLNPLSWNSSGKFLIGAGEGATTLSFANATADLITIGDGTANPNNSGVMQLSITSTVAKTNGAAIRFRNGHNLRASRIRLDANMNRGFQFDGGPQQFLYTLEDFEINSGVNGIVVGDDGTLVQDMWATRGSVFGTSGPGILLRHVSGYFFDAIELLGCSSALATFPDAGKQVIAGICSRLIADSSTGNGFNIITNGGLVADSTFSNCWASSNGSANTGPTGNNGVYISPGAGNVTGFSFPNLRCTNNKGAGVRLAGGTKLTFNAPQIFCNSTVGVNARSGFEVDANVGSWSLLGGVAGIGGLFGGANNQKYGVEVKPGTSANYIIQGVDCTGNATGSILDGGTGAKSVFGNLGYLNAYRGAGAISTGFTFVTIAHGLSVSPAQTDFLLSPTVDLALAGVSRIWVSAVTASTFTVSTNATTTNSLFFAWDVKTGGA